MRIILITWEYPPKIVGGIARHVYDLSNALVKLGIEVRVITCEHPGAAAEEVENGVYIYRVTPEGPGNDFVHWVQLLNNAMYARADRLVTELLEAEKDLSEPVETIIHAHDWLAHFAANGLKKKYGFSAGRDNSCDRIRQEQRHPRPPSGVHQFSRMGAHIRSLARDCLHRVHEA